MTNTPAIDMAPPTQSPKSGLALDPSNAQAKRNDNTIK